MSNLASTISRTKLNPSSSDITISYYDENSLVVRGESLRNYSKILKSCDCIFNMNLRGGSGWLVPSDNERRLRVNMAVKGINIPETTGIPTDIYRVMTTYKRDTDKKIRMMQREITALRRIIEKTHGIEHGLTGESDYSIVVSKIDCTGTGEIQRVESFEGVEERHVAKLVSGPDCAIM